MDVSWRSASICDVQLGMLPCGFSVAGHNDDGGLCSGATALLGGGFSGESFAWFCADANNDDASVPCPSMEALL